MDVKETYEGGSQESGSVRFKTTIECHVVLDVPHNSAKVE